MTTVILAHGLEAYLRDVRPDDREGLELLFAAASDQSLYTRFFAVGHRMVAGHLDHLLSGDPAVHAYVVEAGDRLIGVADVEEVDQVTAEIAFLVADDMHHRGVATLLLEHAAACARGSGVTHFVSDVLSTNHAMLEVFADVGFLLERDCEGIDVSIRMSTSLDENVVRAHAARSASSRLRAVLPTT